MSSQYFKQIAIFLLIFGISFASPTHLFANDSSNLNSPFTLTKAEWLEAMLTLNCKSGLESTGEYGYGTSGYYIVKDTFIVVEIIAWDKTPAGNIENIKKYHKSEMDVVLSQYPWAKDLPVYFDVVVRKSST